MISLVYKGPCCVIGWTIWLCSWAQYA